MLRVPYYLVVCVTPKSMESGISLNLHRFGDGILVEVVEHDADGEISVRSFEFDAVDTEGRVLRPRSTIPSTESRMIEEYVTDAGYTVTDATAQADGPAERGQAIPR